MAYSLYDLNTRLGNIQSEINAIVPSPIPGELIVVDKIIVADQYPAPTLTNTIEPTSILIDDTIGNTAELQKNQLEFVTSGSNNMVLREDELIFSATAGDVATYGRQSLSLEDPAGDYTLLNQTTLNMVTSTTTSFYNSSTLSFTNGATTNTLDATNWTGNIKTVNTVANTTHYLNFSDSAGTGQGHPQKTAGISCNPFTNTITASNFNGNASSASSISLTSDNTSGNYPLIFSKTINSTSTLYVDNTTTSLLYNPFTSSISASNFLGNASSASAISLTSDNTSGNYFLVFSKTVASASPLFVDNVTTPLTYNPSLGTLTANTFVGALSGTATTSTNLSLPTTQTTAVLNAGILSIAASSANTMISYTIEISGGTNTISGIEFNTTRINGFYRIGIYNSGTGNLTINAILSSTPLTTRTNLSSNLIVPTLRYAYMEIHSLTVNAAQQFFANIYLMTP
jgi:hypothetical protein